MKRKLASKSHMGEKIIEAKDISNRNLVQDDRDLVVTGADVEGLYPSLSDIEVAIIVYEAVMNSGIRFENINYHMAGKYVAMHMTEEEQIRSPLARILPRREARGGVCLGVSADPRNDENFSFQKAGGI